ncbi:MAG: hypothetical protein UHG91_07510 [Succinivibrionaceae bacterium]|nr:hypothetical protein [Succinivibrionaceae bacterium]
MNILKNSLSKIALIIGALTLFGCAEIASLAISQGESVDKSRVEASQSYGYIARFSENPATKNSICIKDLSLVYNKEAITLKMIIVNPGTQNQSVISVFESPTYRMHVAEMELFDKDNTLISNLSYSFKDSNSLYEAIPKISSIPINRLVDYLVSFRSDECKDISYDEFDNVKFIDYCLIDEGQYEVSSWVSFDGGFYFPKKFTFTNGWGEVLSLTTIVAHELDKKTMLNLKNQIVKENIPNIEEKISQGKIEKVTDVNDAKVKFKAMVGSEVLTE